MNAAQRYEIFSRFQAANPRPTTELHFGNTFELLIAVILSAQSTDVSVNKVTPALFQAAPTPDAMVRLGVGGVEEHIKTLGLFRNKAKNVVACCRRLVEVYGGEVPDTREDLESLAGVGRKTANVVLNTAFGQPTLAVDTHIFRVANRTGLGRGKDVAAVEKALLKNIPPQFLSDAHHWLILHGRYTCRARKPLCGQCMIADLCAWRDKVF